MKTFNYKLNLLLFVIAIGLAFSCKKESVAPKPQPSPFTAVVEGGVTTLPAAGGKLTILIGAGEDGWWVTTAQADWVTLTKVYGSGDFKLPVTVKANTSGVARIVSLKINPTFNLPPVILNINQDK